VEVFLLHHHVFFRVVAHRIQVVSLERDSEPSYHAPPSCIRVLGQAARLAHRSRRRTHSPATEALERILDESRCRGP
jgi:hypothetical protein